MNRIIRSFNTTKDGYAWTESTKTAVWTKGTPIPDYDPAVWRRDRCGRAIKWTDHGDRNSDYGWEIDHINPVSNGGGDELENLQPLHWSNNMSKSDNIFWSCPA